MKITAFYKEIKKFNNFHNVNKAKKYSLDVPSSPTVYHDNNVTSFNDCVKKINQRQRGSMFNNSRQPEDNVNEEYKDLSVNCNDLLGQKRYYCNKKSKKDSNEN